MNDLLYEIARWLILTPVKLIVELVLWLMALAVVIKLARG